MHQSSQYNGPLPKGLLINEHTRKTVRSTRQGGVRIRLPERLDFEENYEDTVSQFHNIRLAADKNVQLDGVDFSAVRYISTSAALVLASVVDRWNQKENMRLRATIRNWHEDIRRLLGQMGYFELLGLKKPKLLPFSKPTVFLPFKRGIISDGDGGKLAKEMRLEIEQTVGAQIKKMPLFEGLSEAITNVSHHAYPEDAAIKQWWLSASYDSSTRHLFVTFYDQGAGIPETLPGADFFEVIADFFHLWSDSDKIQAAMEAGRSSTGESQRGKGLLNLLEFARSYNGGALAIYSLRGKYRLDARKTSEETILDIEKKDFEHSIGGTLIEWSVQLPPST